MQLIITLFSLFFMFFSLSLFPSPPLSLPKYSPQHPLLKTSLMKDVTEGDFEIKTAIDNFSSIDCLKYAASSLAEHTWSQCHCYASRCLHGSQYIYEKYLIIDVFQKHV